MSSGADATGNRRSPAPKSLSPKTGPTVSGFPLRSRHAAHRINGNPDVLRCREPERKSPDPRLFGWRIEKFFRVVAAAGDA